MKLSLILLFITCLQVSAYTHTYGQNISLRKTNVPLEEVLKDIQKQSGYHIFYDASLIDKAPRVSLQLNDVSVKEALDETLKNLDLGYEEVNKNIIIRTLDKSNSFIKTMQQKTVTGKVTDENGNPLLGVTVAVKGRPQIGTTTDGNGMYVLNIPEDVILLFRYIGYLEQEVYVGNQSSINVSLLVDQAGLEEVVIVGFGQQKRESVVASVATIKGEQLRMPNRSLSNNLAGQLPGLIAVQRSGEPGYDNAEFWIRGVSSFAGGTNPLVLVDGVPRDMNDIEPDEIETFTLLKDASATSVYGSEGANGVVLITSKRGRVQKASISYRGEVSRLTPTRIPRFANSFDYLSLYNEALRNDGDPEYISEGELAKYASGEDPDLYPDVDWWSALVKDHTSNTRHTLNFRGGSDRMKYFVSGAYFGETGLYKTNDKFNNNSDLNRYNLRSNVDIDITSSTLLKVDLSGQYLKVNLPSISANELIPKLVFAPPHVVPHIYSDGTLAAESGVFNNPFNVLTEEGYRKQWRSGIQSKIDLDQRLDVITPGLKVRAAVSYDANATYDMSRFREPETFYAEGRDAYGQLVFAQITSEVPFKDPKASGTGNKKIYLESSLNYNRAFDKHNVEGMFLYYQKESQLHNNALAFRKQSWVGRSSYSFDNRYIFEANFGVTGSEQFADGFRYGFFPAVGLAWNVMNERFIPESIENVISAFKLRASIGRTGNDNTGSERFLYKPTFGTSTGYNWGIGSTGAINGVGNSIIEGRFESPFLSWEIEMKRNIGIDLSLFNGKIDIQADYFNNKRTNILLQRKTVSGVAGFEQSPWQNFGQVSNKGMDGSLNMHHKFGEVNLSLRGNFTFARNKILEYDEVPKAYPWMQVTGTKLNSLRGLVAERLFREDDFDILVDASGKKTYTLREGIAPFTQHPNPLPGDIKYIDQNGDGVVDNNIDHVIDFAHPTVPEIIYGFGTNVSYKGVYLNLFFQGASNTSLNLNNDAYAFQPHQGGVLGSSVRQEIVESRWTVENPSQDVFFPRMSMTKVNTNSTYNTWWFRDASFLRLKNVEVGYSLSNDIASKVKMRNVRVYVIGQNVALWDKVEIFDPEMGTSGAGSKYPIPSIWSLGLEFTF